MRRGSFLVMRWAPLIGRGGRRRISVAYRARNLAEALLWAAEYERRGALWIARLGQASHRRQSGREWAPEARGAELRGHAGLRIGEPGIAARAAALQRDYEKVKTARPAQEARALRFPKWL